MAQLWSVAKRRWRSRKCTDCVDGTTLVLHRTVARPPPHNCCRSCGTRRPRGPESSEGWHRCSDQQAEVVGFIYHRVYTLTWALRCPCRRLDASKRRGRKASQAALRHVAYWHLQRKADAIVPSPQIRSRPAAARCHRQSCCRELRCQPGAAGVSAQPGPLSIEAQGASYQGAATAL